MFSIKKVSRRLLRACEGATQYVTVEYNTSIFLIVSPLHETYLNKQSLTRPCRTVNIVPGTIVETHEPDLLNIAYFISSSGTILSSYQKKNLWHPERPHLTSSAHEPHVAFDTPLGRVGMLICWDLAFPEAFRELVAGGAKIIIVPTFWTLEDVNESGRRHNPLSEELFLESTLVARAFENTCAVVFANAGGPKEEGVKSELEWAGLSQVSVPFKGALGKLGRGEGMSVVDVDMQICELLFNFFSLLA